MAASSLLVVTPVAQVEAALVLIGRFGWSRAEFDRAWTSLALEEVPVDTTLASLAISAFESWGRGRPKASLNFGDCFSYALATSRAIPLLFVGDDFASTDVERA